MNLCTQLFDIFVCTYVYVCVRMEAIDYHLHRQSLTNETESIVTQFMTFC